MRRTYLWDDLASHVLKNHGRRVYVFGYYVCLCNIENTISTHKSNSMNFWFPSRESTWCSFTKKRMCEHTKAAPYNTIRCVSRYLVNRLKIFIRTSLYVFLHNTTHTVYWCYIVCRWTTSTIGARSKVEEILERGKWKMETRIQFEIIGQQCDTFSFLARSAIFMLLTRNVQAYYIGISTMIKQIWMALTNNIKKIKWNNINISNRANIIERKKILYNFVYSSRGVSGWLGFVAVCCWFGGRRNERAAVDFIHISLNISLLSTRSSLFTFFHNISCHTLRYFFPNKKFHFRLSLFVLFSLFFISTFLLFVSVSVFTCLFFHYILSLVVTIIYVLFLSVLWWRLSNEQMKNSSDYFFSTHCGSRSNELISANNWW